MNYRHAFHAGNFADCMKHVLLVWMLRALARKPAGFMALDTHAGLGRYDLGGDQASRTGEWRGGIGRLLAARDAGLSMPEGIGDYLGLVDRPDLFGSGLYPGSPALIEALLRPEDRLVCCELHPEDQAGLRALMRGHPQVSVHLRDGYEAIRAFLPPRERRALVLIDPPYEAPDEFARLTEALRQGCIRFPSGILVVWYPIKHRAPARAFHAAVAEAGIRDVVAVELLLREPTDADRLNGCGLLVVNPPWRFMEEAEPMLASLAAIFAGDEGTARAVRIAGE
ncbi:23S rRNA (adenine(2030)-N(6))-methyltransferase RlmJ [Acidisoma sp.]|uniref:23S rRNA (adenine(2030)-N(6))-methyltransferase RlmJ n=1 Tax=Acidisoma sp. TaxID=1872115 RepID=UPI003B006DA8